jgi:hypothetical protein
MTTYHTEGIVKDIHLKQNAGSFTLEAEKPYSIEEKNGDKTEKAILFVADGGREQSKSPATGNGEKIDSKDSQPRHAYLVPVDACFEFLPGEEQENRIDMTVLLFLKQNRSKVRVVLGEKAVKGKSAKKSYAVSEIVIK